MEFEQLLQLIDHVSDSKLTSFQYEGENLKVSMECGQVQTVTAVGSGDLAIQTVETVTPESSEITHISHIKAAQQEGNLVKSPLVGTFYAAPAEDAQPFVKVGDKVSKGQTLAIVEAMKLMNEIESDFDGEVAEIYVQNGQAVEYGMPLFRIK